FQAEDGIRDRTVTGVQTCALPIFCPSNRLASTPIVLLGVGSLLGLLLGVLASRLLGQIVYQANPRDPVVIVGAVLTMALLGIAASAIPALRALAVDPSKLMREE